MAFEELGKAFVGHYYPTLASNRSQLELLYADTSMMTFEGTPCQGKSNIMTKVMSLTFKTIQHQITSIDCQPVVTPDNTEAVNVLVMGQLQTDSDPPHSFVQHFLLKKDASSFFIANETFRMILHS